MTSKKLIVLGAGEDQLFLIKTALKMGLEVFVFDHNEYAPGFREAGEGAAISTHNTTEMIKSIEWHSIKPIGVITMGSDIPQYVERVAKHFDLPRISAPAAWLSVDKLHMKRRLETFGIPIPAYYEINDHEDIRRLLGKHERLVVKPVDRSGSRGVSLVDHSSASFNPETAYALALDASYSKHVMAEEHLPGLQVSTETILVDREGATLGFADRNYDQPQFIGRFVENGGWMPSKLPSAMRTEVKEMAAAASLALGVFDGTTKGDFVITQNGPVVIEIAARLSGGDFSQSLVPLSTGINYVETAIRIALGEKPEIPKATINRAAANRYFYPPAGVLSSIDGIGEVEEKAWVHKLHFEYDIGDEVPSPTEAYPKRFGVFVVSADDRIQLEARIKWVYKTIKIHIGKKTVASAS